MQNKLYSKIPQFRKRLASVSFSLIFCIVFFSAIELILREFSMQWYYPSQTKRQHLTPDGPLKLYYFPMPGFSPLPTFKEDNLLFIPDARTFWRLRPNFQQQGSQRYSVPNSDVIINSRGWRNREFLQTPAQNTVRILCLGDSVTFGYGLSVGQNAAFPERLEANLHRQRAETNWEVINCGVPGFTSYQGRQVIGEALSYKPHLIIVSFGHNDMSKREMDDASFGEISGSRVSLIKLSMERFEIYRMLRFLLTFWRNSSEKEAKIQRVSDSQFAENFKFICEKSKEVKARVLLLNTTFSPEVDSKISSSLQEISLKNRVDFLDLAPVLIDKSKNILDDPVYGKTAAFYKKIYANFCSWNPCLMEESIHPNSLGHQIIADEIAQYLENRGILEELKGFLKPAVANKFQLMKK